MNFGLDRLWWAVALRGILAIVFGALVFFWPGFFWLVVVYTFGVYALVDGAVSIYLAVAGQGQAGRWWALLLRGLAGVAAGIVTLVWPGITELALLYVIAAWAVVTGVFEIVTAVRLRRYIRGEWALILSGALMVILGVAMAIVPVAGLLAIAWWVGATSIASGILLVALAIRLRTMGQGRAPEALAMP